MKGKAAVREGTRESRTRYVVLGMLLQGPATGYALRQRILASVGNFWHESFGQLYPTLALLHREGLVGLCAAPGARAATRPYQITASGKRHLKQWLGRDPQPQAERNELLLKVFFAELAPDSVCELVQRARTEAVQGTKRLEQMRGELAQRLAGHPSLPAWLATVDFGLAGQRALATWCASTEQELVRMAGEPAGAPAQRRNGRRKTGGAGTGGQL